jgi:hypothetical protein
MEVLEVDVILMVIMEGLEEVGILEHHQEVGNLVGHHQVEEEMENINKKIGF